MKNIVFDLAGVVVARNQERCPQYIMDYFYFINSGDPMPEFWNDYDRGTRTIDAVATELAKFRNSDFQTAKSRMLEAITYQDMTQMLIYITSIKNRIFITSLE